MSNNRFPGSTPVITTAGRLVGYVFTAPMSPTERVEHDHGQTEHWTYALGTSSYVTPFRVRTRREAVYRLLGHRGIDDPQNVSLVDLDLARVLHGLTERYTRQEIGLAATLYAAAAPDLDVFTDHDVPVDGAPVDRRLIRHTITGLIGATTAAEVLAAYDAIAPTAVPTDSGDEWTPGVDPAPNRTVHPMPVQPAG